MQNGSARLQRRDKYGNLRTGLKFYEFQTNFNLHRQPLHLRV